MDTDKVIQDLNHRFAAPMPEFYQCRIIFWYDEDKEFSDLKRIFTIRFDIGRNDSHNGRCLYNT